MCCYYVTVQQYFASTCGPKRTHYLEVFIIVKSSLPHCTLLRWVRSALCSHNNRHESRVLNAKQETYLLLELLKMRGSELFRESYLYSPLYPAVFTTKNASSGKPKMRNDDVLLSARIETPLSFVFPHYVKYVATG